MIKFIKHIWFVSLVGVMCGCSSTNIQTYYGDADKYLAKSVASAIIYDLSINNTIGNTNINVTRHKGDVFDYIARRVLNKVVYTSFSVESNRTIMEESSFKGSITKSIKVIEKELSKTEQISKLTDMLKDTGYPEIKRKRIATRIIDAYHTAYDPLSFIYYLRNELKYGYTDVNSVD